jgi:hypothetical protein
MLIDLIIGLYDQTLLRIVVIMFKEIFSDKNAKTKTELV